MEKKKTSVIITRVFWCQRCFEAKRPQKGDMFLKIGRRRQRVEVGKVTENGHFGFTPSLIDKTNVKNGIVTIAVTCAMGGCDTHIEYIEEKDKHDWELLYATIHTLPIKEWNSLVNYTRDPDYWLG